MKIERYDDETDEEWDERLGEEIADADNYITTRYFVERDSYNETQFIVNYVTPNAFTWKEHPEGPFTCKQIMEWKEKYHLWEKLMSLSTEIKSLDELFQWIIENMTVVSKQ